MRIKLDLYRKEKGEVVACPTTIDFYKYETGGGQFSPSGLSSFMDCPAFAHLPSISSEAAEKGKQLHADAESLIRRGLEKDMWPWNSRDQQDPVLRYVSDVFDYVVDYDFKYLGIETKFTIKSDELNGNRFAAIADFFMYSDGLLVVGDLKTGKYEVPAKDNKQLLGTAMCIKEALSLNVKELHVFIHQNGFMDLWKVDLSQYKEFLKEFKGFFKQDDLTYYNLKYDCNNCFKREVCPVMGTKIKKDVVEFNKMTSISDLSPPDTVELYKKALNVKKLADTVIKMVKRRTDDKELEGYVKKVTVANRRVWKDKKKALKILGDKIKKYDIIPVKDAEKLFGKEALKDLVEIRKSSSYVPNYDKEDEELFT